MEAPLGGAYAFQHARAMLGEVEVLEPWADVDTPEELEVLLAEVRSDPARAPALTAWLRESREGRVGESV
jgi:hypothetical protein